MGRRDPDRDFGEAGVPLGAYRRNFDGFGVRFICTACQASHDVPIERVLARLQARGLGGEATGIRDVARRAARPCRRCGAMRWETRPAFPSFAKPPQRL